MMKGKDIVQVQKKLKLVLLDSKSEFINELMSDYNEMIDLKFCMLDKLRDLYAKSLCSVDDKTNEIWYHQNCDDQESATNEPFLGDDCCCISHCPSIDYGMRQALLRVNCNCQNEDLMEEYINSDFDANKIADMITLLDDSFADMIADEQNHIQNLFMLQLMLRGLLPVAAGTLYPTVLWRILSKGLLDDLKEEIYVSYCYTPNLATKYSVVVAGTTNTAFMNELIQLANTIPGRKKESLVFCTVDEFFTTYAQLVRIGERYVRTEAYSEEFVMERVKCCFRLTVSQDKRTYCYSQVDVLAMSKSAVITLDGMVSYRWNELIGGGHVKVPAMLDRRLKLVPIETDRRFPDVLSDIKEDTIYEAKFTIPDSVTIYNDIMVNGTDPVRLSTPAVDKDEFTVWFNPKTGFSKLNIPLCGIDGCLKLPTVGNRYKVERVVKDNSIIATISVDFESKYDCIRLNEYLYKTIPLENLIKLVGYIQVDDTKSVSVVPITTTSCNVIKVGSYATDDSIIVHQYRMTVGCVLVDTDASYFSMEVRKGAFITTIDSGEISEKTILSGNTASCVVGRFGRNGSLKFVKDLQELIQQDLVTSSFMTLVSANNWVTCDEPVVMSRNEDFVQLQIPIHLDILYGLKFPDCTMTANVFMSKIQVGVSAGAGTYAVPVKSCRVIKAGSSPYTCEYVMEIVARVPDIKDSLLHVILEHGAIQFSSITAKRRIVLDGTSLRINTITGRIMQEKLTNIIHLTDMLDLNRMVQYIPKNPNLLSDHTYLVVPINSYMPEFSDSTTDDSTFTSVHTPKLIIRNDDGTCVCCQAFIASHDEVQNQFINNPNNLYHAVPVPSNFTLDNLDNVSSYQYYVVKIIGVHGTVLKIKPGDELTFVEGSVKRMLQENRVVDNMQMKVVVKD